MTPLPPAPAPAGASQQIAPDLRLVLAPNPSPMTYWGTNTFLLGRDALTIIDPGPDLPDHLAALLAAIGNARVEAILVTHSHVDHSPLAAPLARETGAPVLAFGPSGAGRSQVMEALAAEGGLGGGEGIDATFAPDRCLADTEQITTDAGPITALHTPGHMSNHMSFLWRDRVFCGDHVMGWASSLVSPPDGDLTAFMASCRRLAALPFTQYHPAHGPALDDGPARLAWLIAHREGREAQIREALSEGPATIRTLTRRIYHDVPEALLPAAERNVLAQLVDLAERGHVRAAPRLSATAHFEICQ